MHHHMFDPLLNESFTVSMVSPWSQVASLPALLMGNMWPCWVHCLRFCSGASEWPGGGAGEGQLSDTHGGRRRWEQRWECHRCPGGATASKFLKMCQFKKQSLHLRRAIHLPFIANSWVITLVIFPKKYPRSVTGSCFWLQDFVHRVPNNMY